MVTESSNASVEIERHAAHLAGLEDEEPPFVISGIAIGENDVTMGQSGIKKKWTREALEEAADSLADRPLVVDHENGAYGVVGEVSKVDYKPTVGVLYEAELDDRELAEKVANGRLEVSIRGFHEDVEEMQEDAETGAKLVTKLKFDNLSIVPTGAAPSNTVGMGELDPDEVAAGDYQPPTVEAGPSQSITAAQCAQMLDPEFDGSFDEESDTDEEEAAKRPEGAEEHGNPNKYAEQPERYPEGEDHPDADEASEDEADDAETAETADAETSPHDDADTSSEEGDAQSRGAGAGDEPDPIAANLTFISPTMSDETEEKLAEYDDPTVIEGDELETLREQADKVEDLAEKVEDLEAQTTDTEEEASEADESAVEELKAQFEDDLSALKERTSVLDEVNRDDVDDLAETDNPVILEESEYDSLSDTVDEVKGIYAEALSGHIALDAETITGKFSLSEMKEELESRLDDDETVEDELSPDVKGDDPAEEDLEEAADEAHEDELEETDEDIEELQADLRERVLGLSDD